MARRLTLTILFTVWTALLAAGLTAYWLTRSVLLADLDESLHVRAAALPELVSTLENGPTTRLAPVPTEETPEGGRYLIRSESSRRSLPRATTNSKETGERTQVSAASFSTLADGRRVRTVTVRASAKPMSPGGSPVPVIVTYSGSAESFDRVLAQMAWTFTVCGVAAGVVSAVVARRLAGAALRPLTTVADLIGTVDERSLNRRLPVDALPPELVATGTQLNEMLAKLQEATERRRQFLADASHELRTPVAALVTGLEVAFLKNRTPEAYRAILKDALQDAGSLRQLVERLMEQVRNERLDPVEQWETLDVVPLLQNCARIARTLGEPRGQQVSVDLPASLLMRTQPRRLTSIATNLLANAVEYNADGGFVSMRAYCEAGAFHLSIRDTGRGIADHQREAIFDPFYRGDVARSGEDGHLGLGLYTVRTHVAVLSGECRLESKVGVGTEFHVILPGVACAVKAAPLVGGLPTHDNLMQHN